MKPLLLILAFLVMGCGREEAMVRPKQFVDPTLRSFVDHYIDVAGDRGHMDERAVARCTKWQAVGATHRKIVVSKSTVESTPRTNLARVISHELGHCLHDLKHVAAPLALMNPMDDGEHSYWKANLDEAIREALGE